MKSERRGRDQRCCCSCRNCKCLSFCSVLPCPALPCSAWFHFSSDHKTQKIIGTDSELSPSLPFSDYSWLPFSSYASSSASSSSSSFSSRLVRQPAWLVGIKLWTLSINSGHSKIQYPVREGSQGNRYGSLLLQNHWCWCWLLRLSGRWCPEAAAQHSPHAYKILSN